MKLLYIDKAKSIDDLRIGEKSIFFDNLPKMGIEVHFLFYGNKKSSKIKKNTFFHYRMNTFYKSYLSLDFIAILLKGLFLTKRYKFEYIISRKNATTSLAGVFISKLFKIKHIYIMSFPKWEAIKLKGNSKPYKFLLKIISKIYKLLIIFIIKNSYYIFPQTEQFWFDFIKDTKFSKKKILPIPMCFEMEISDPKILKDHYRKKHNLPLENKILIYFGSLDTERNINFIIDIFSFVLDLFNNTTILIIGGNTHQIFKINDYISTKKFYNKYITMPSQNRDVLYEYIIASDLSVSALPPIPTYIISSPTKVIESMGLGTPVIANSEIIDHNEIIKTSKAGKLVEYDRNSFARMIVNIIKDDKELLEMSTRGINYIKQNRNYAKISKNIIELLSNE